MGVKEKLQEWLTEGITPKDLAMIIRRFKYETIKMVLHTQEEKYCKDWIAEGHYFLTELCEILDPQLEEPTLEDEN